MRQVDVDQLGEIRFPAIKEVGLPVDPEKAPSYEEALRIIKRLDYLLNKKGPGSQRRVKQAAEIAFGANDYEVWSRSLLNKDGTLFPIKSADKDTFMDPATETYHSM